MKFGIRKPSPKKRLTDRLSVKKQLVNRGKLKMPKGYGFIRNPKKALYNKVYNKTSISPGRLLKKLFK